MGSVLGPRWWSVGSVKPCRYSGVCDVCVGTAAVVCGGLCCDCGGGLHGGLTGPQRWSVRSVSTVFWPPTGPAAIVIRH